MMQRMIAFSGLVAAAFAFSAPVQAQSNLTNPGGQQNARFCHQQGSGTNQQNCIYATMAACQNIAKAQGGSCVENPKMTTGSGSSGSGSMQKDNMKKN